MLIEPPPDAPPPPTLLAELYCLPFTFEPFDVISPLLYSVSAYIINNPPVPFSACDGAFFVVFPALAEYAPSPALFPAPPEAPRGAD